jgi:hypothetical protein
MWLPVADLTEDMTLFVTHTTDCIEIGIYIL